MLHALQRELARLRDDQAGVRGARRQRGHALGRADRAQRLAGLMAHPAHTEDVA